MFVNYIKYAATAFLLVYLPYLSNVFSLGIMANWTL